MKIRFFFIIILLTLFTGAKAAKISIHDSTAQKADEGRIDKSPVINGSEISIIVKETTQPIVIDGNLSDPAWQTAVPYHEYFFQQEPLDRAPSSEKTLLMVLQDNKNIYFGMQAYDSEPEKIFASVMRLDGSFLNDDALELLIDTFQDKRNSYAFGTNPLGVKVDAIISDEGNHINKSWDCIWYCRARKNAEGWAAEMAIPFKSIRFKKGDQVDWGLNITREIKHRQEITYLAPISRGLGHNGKFKGSLFANLKNIKPPRSGLNLEIQPYAKTGRTQISNPSHVNSNLTSGLDVRYHVTPQLTVDATYETDFAQVEADQEIINVTRFNINLPEKREFFLESAGLFTFGTGSKAGGTLVGIPVEPGFLLFNSRTIGIRGGETIPLIGGSKVAGRIGKYSLGMMNLQSEEKTLTGGDVEPSSNFTALKLKRDIHTNSNVGLMVLNKQSASDNYSRAIGSDAFVAFSPAFIFSGSIARSFSPGKDSKDWAGHAGLILNKEWIDAVLNYQHIDSLFNPEMGFVQRGNIRNLEGSVSLTQWINNNYLRSISGIYANRYYMDHHAVMQSRLNWVEAVITMRTGDMLIGGIIREYEFLPGDDYIRNIRINPGKYEGNAPYISLTTYRARRVSVDGGISWGDRYDGAFKKLSFGNSTKFNNHFLMDIIYSYDKLQLKNGALAANILASRFTYSVTTELFAKCFVQWNDADRRFSTNILVDYIYKPRSHIYLVYNENRNTLNRLSNNLRDRILLLKFTYLLSL